MKMLEPEPHWTEMARRRQDLQRLSRELLRPMPESLNATEFEILSRLFLSPEANTPQALSLRTGMKKESVSRCLKRLVERGAVARRKNPCDERSVLLALTESGRSELQEGYEAMLQPFYDLRRAMPEDFDALFVSVRKISSREGA